MIVECGMGIVKKQNVPEIFACFQYQALLIDTSLLRAE